VVTDYISKRDVCFATFAEVLAALESVRSDFEYQVLGPYEKKKAVENGNVWGKLATG
jgi:hypothetical protein